MQDTSRFAFLMLMNVFVIALLLIPLNGCVVMPSRYQHGDFVSNMASTADKVPATGNDQRRG